MVSPAPWQALQRPRPPQTPQVPVGGLAPPKPEPAQVLHFPVPWQKTQRVPAMVVPRPWHERQRPEPGSPSQFVQGLGATGQPSPEPPQTEHFPEPLQRRQSSPAMVGPVP